MALLERLIVLSLLISYTMITNVDASACEVGEMQCKNRECVSLSWKCDGEDDCGDNSDETDCPKKKCPHADQFQCNNGRCILNSWKCDKADDCGDNSDESETEGAMCSKNATCPSTDFQCKVSKVCIKKIFVCDERKDCGANDNSDEENCDAHKCRANEFQCGNGRCISASFRCNRRAECDDRSDEKNCSSAPCSSNHFKCVESGHCIQKGFRCDGRNDCLDGSDEMNCQTSTAASTTLTEKKTTKPTTKLTTPKTCILNYFKCKVDEKCIHNSWLCDGEADCKDGEDESRAVCDKRTCSPQQFACKNGKCITMHLKCDSIDQCGDNSDEESCPLRPLQCRSTSFKCRNSSVCIEQNLVCDGHKDCPHGDDEPAVCGQNECLKNDHGCSQNCVDLKIGYKCTCNAGYHLTSNNKTCVNENECHRHGICSQKCVDLKGSYKCLCTDGYALDGDLRTCRAVGPVPVLIFSNRVDIRQIQTNGQHYKPVIHTRHIRSAISIDLDMHGKEIYWADNINRTITRASLQHPDQVKTILTNVHKPEGIAFDWIGKKIYWTDTHPKYGSCLEVSNPDGSHRLVLVHKKLDQPRAVAVHSTKRLIFWTDWGAIPKIERMGMDGLGRQIIVSNNDVTWPNGLSIDFANNRLFWVDGKRNCIGSSDFDGANLVIVATGIQHPFGLTVFEDYVYWTNYRGRKVFRANKFTGKDKFEFQDGFFSPMDIQVNHPVVQQRGQNPCSTNNGGCSHLCLLSATSLNGFSCACPTEIKMLADGKTCDVVIPTTKAPVLATTVSKEPTAKTGVAGCFENQFTCPSSRNCISKSKLCDGVSDCPNDEDETLDQCNSVEQAKSSTNKSKSKGSSSPLIAGIIAGIAFIVLVIVIIALLVCKRRRHEANLSITFQQRDAELVAVQTVKFNANGKHKWPSKDFENINYTDANEKEELIRDPGLMNVPDDSSSDNGSTCDETKPVMQHQQSTSSNSIIM